MEGLEAEAGERAGLRQQRASTATQRDWTLSIGNWESL